jgi:hypothetical protein
MPVSVYLNGETSRYISAFGIAAIVVEADRILVCHRPGDIPDYGASFFFLRQPSRPKAPRPVAKSGNAPGSGTGLTPSGVAMPLAEIERTRRTLPRPRDARSASA